MEQSETSIPDLGPNEVIKSLRRKDYDLLNGLKYSLTAHQGCFHVTQRSSAKEHCSSAIKVLLKKKR